MPVSLRQEINDHGPPFQYDLPSEIISRESHGETEVNVPQEVAEPRFPLATRGESKHSASETFANSSSRINHSRELAKGRHEVRIAKGIFGWICKFH